MATFLELVQELVTELGIGGANQGATEPSTVAGQTGQLWNAVNWIKQAENNLNLLHNDWKFLSVEYSEALTTSSSAVPAHSGAEVPKLWDRDSFWLDRTNSRAAPLTFQNWEIFRRDTLPGEVPASPGGDSKPSIITQKRDGTLLLDVNSDSNYTLTAEFWKRPVLLSADGDIPAMPAEYHRLIICEAAIKYGNKEAAIEVINGMEAEYEFLLDKLESNELAGAEYDNLHTQDVPIVIGLPDEDPETDRGTNWWL